MGLQDYLLFNDFGNVVFQEVFIILVMEEDWHGGKKQTNDFLLNFQGIDRYIFLPAQNLVPHLKKWDTVGESDIRLEV